MDEKHFNFLKKPLNSLTYNELIIQSVIGSVLGIVVGIFYAIIGSYLIGYGFNVLFASVMIISFLYLIFFIFKPIFERYIRFNSDFGENHVYYEAKAFLFLFGGILFTILVVSIFLLAGSSFITLAGYALSFFFPFFVVFLRRDYLYNENGDIDVENDYEFAYDIPILVAGALYLCVSTLPMGFLLLHSSIFYDWPSVYVSFFVIIFQTIIFYIYLCPDFWNKYLPLNIKRKKGMFFYAVTFCFALRIFYILVFGFFGLI